MSKRTQFFRCKSTEKILKWLETNYELCDDVCLPRCLLYKHYLDYCGSIKSEPISAAAFGKIIRRKFNKIATRRLGTRGQSKYHYFGLAIKKSSPYYGDYLENSQRLRTKLRKVGCRKKMLTSNHLNTNLIDKVNQLMDNFPQANEFVNPSNPAYRNIETFLCMYKTHCDHLADIIINFKLDSIQLHLRHFWLQLPCHFDRLLQSDLLSKLIQCCDYTFFEGLLNALYPQNFKTVSSQTLNYLNILTNNFELWLREALIGLPDSLISVKVEALHHFVRSIKRYKYLFPLIKSCSYTLNQKELLSLMTDDLQSLDLDSILDDSLLNCNNNQLNQSLTLLVDFFAHLQSTTDLDTFFSSLRRLFHISLKNCQSSCIVSRSTEFILIVNRLIVCLCRELTINYVPTLNHWITLFSTIREYSILVAEETIRHDNFQINKLSIICWDNFSFDNINFCDSLLAR
ncbi:DNA-binding protein RFX6-like isoform X1 [Tetranychus urticae]|uniref:DNA-binding protein RFX6-like isoform X1 n=1 Tax=Tetranychus urticae TaxID=32264 RepID=UPI000D644F36|nr:DNA-binding protein RFX6-like isoform X1 [Tetranychus urticae]XP_025018198.1 DNA-binding protein RFX6-like isoform X1 [Tetranychus urticae]